jgi:hypothetical protein
VAALQINENIPDAVRDFIRIHVERQFSDARSMMMLKYCCNFAITALLVNLISGMSTVFYDQQGNSGDRFKNMLIEVLPMGSTATGQCRARRCGQMPLRYFTKSLGTLP